MSWETAGQNVAVDALAGAITDVSLHSSAPNSSGSNEVSGGGYARLEPSYGSASSGSADLSAPLEFSTPSEQTVSHIGFWASATFLGGFARTAGDSAANVAGEYVVTSAPITFTS